MNEKELIKWFWDKFNSCYLVKHDYYTEVVFMYYDPQYVRKLKLANISGEKINKTDITGICLFEQDWKNKIFYYDYYEIRNYLCSNYSNKEIQQFISDRLKEHSKMSVLTPMGMLARKEVGLKGHSKMSVLTPILANLPNLVGLKEHSKMNVLVPAEGTFHKIKI